MKLMLAQNIRTQRKAHSLTQENLAEAIGAAPGSCLQKCPCRPPLGGLPGPADGMAGRPTPALTAKGQGRARRRCVR